MTVNKNNSDIADSFKNLLKKADEMALEKKKDDILDSKLINDKKNNFNLIDSTVPTLDRLGIKIIKRIPENPFIVKSKNKNELYLKKRKELIIKLSMILNKHIHYWLQKEMPKFARLQLKKHVANSILNIRK